MSAKVTVYISNLSSNMEVKKQQMRIMDVLQGLKIDFETVDVAANKDDLEKMREIVGDAKALAPQIVKGDQYCGNYEAFDAAVEVKEVNDFLKL